MNLQKWISFPESLPTQKFTGYQTRYDETQNRGAFLVGQNVKMTQAQTPTLRDGFELIGTNLADSYPVQRAWVFETREGAQFELKAYDTGVYYYLWGTSTDWALLKSGFTAALDFGYGNIGKSANTTASCFFSNGTDGVYEFNGAYATIASVTGSTITKTGSSTWAGAGFYDADITASTIAFVASSPATITDSGSGFVTAGFKAGMTIAISGTVSNNVTRTIATVSAGTLTLTTGETLVGEGAGSSFTIEQVRTVIYQGTVYTYTGGESTTTLTGVTPDPTLQPIAAGGIVVQQPNKQNQLNTIQGSVMMAHDGRLHMRYDAKADVWQYSKLDDPFDFTTGSSDGDGGAKEIEFGGAILSFAKLNQTAQALKTRLIKNLNFNQVGSKVDSPQYTTLVSADDKGTSLGATNQKSTFSTPFGLVFITPDNRMVLLTGVTANNQPQYFFLSDPVAEVFSQGVHDTGAGICVDNRIYYSFKQNNQSTFNDVEIQGNMLRQTFDAQGRAIPIFWDTPNVGVNCNDYTAVYNSAVQKFQVHRHSSLNSNSFAIIDNKTDETNSFTGIVRTWGEVFGAPDQQKLIDYVMVEIKMLQNSVVTATVLFDQNGASGQQSYTLSGADTGNMVQTALYNPFGASPYGEQRIGSNTQQQNLQRYIYWLELNPNQEFFSVALQLSTDTENSDFELIRFGYRLVQIIPDVDFTFKKNTDE